MTTPSVTMNRVNAMAPADFVATFGHLFEHSPWVAERAAALRPFATPDAMLLAMTGVLDRAADDEKLALVRAHPELARRAGLDPTLTQASAAEQASAGLDRLTPDEYARFNRLNDAYAARFAMPFVICVRLSDKDVILSEMERRVAHTPQAELQAAIVEIGKIAGLRLADTFKTLAENAENAP
ncbi:MULTISPECIES: 2-oxo-4-hydroxy-4-carboxy-5-ureidoimidazoline decarboxylase [Nguyenibacter]|uniref:2-oxo-4-hydroxy-4-carboxy-5-ureidoimidazoline decarboxylase n=1 Tax=Nguyenibacter vanlangensis TaxID=1216886 RepID=A0ABZ3D6P9_9PROT|nr:2-oxo-4-hydroxy-4-carboxy-5-ureidoimidazoline decarboxylase [Nguyenibacter sp. L1]WRH88273.1 2-oxo-4-hydroxy-4-carboxy-5-ureidoimidazoline decarboxylase [Nguyenibacter sp. L1]